MLGYGLKGFFQRTTALAAISSVTVVAAAAKPIQTVQPANAGPSPLPYYSLSASKVLVWPNGKSEKYVLAAFREGQWQFFSPEGEIAIVLPPLKALFKVSNQQPRLGAAHGQKSPYTLQLWQPAARIILLHNQRIAVIADEKMAVADYSTENANEKPAVQPALKLLKDSIGSDGMAAITGGPVTDVGAWIKSVEQVHDPFVAPLSKQKVSSWILVDRLTQEELNKLTGGIEVQPSVHTTISPITTPPNANELGLNTFLLVFLVVINLTLIGISLFNLWRRKNRNPALKKTKSQTNALTKTPQAGAIAEGTAREAAEALEPLLEMIQEVFNGLEQDQPGSTGKMSELEEAAYRWVSGRYRKQVVSASANAPIIAKAYQTFQSRFLLGEFGTDKISDVKHFAQLGRQAGQAAAQIQSSGFHSAEFQGLRGATIFQVLPTVLTVLDQKLRALQQQVEQYKTQLERSKLLVGRAEELKSELDKRKVEIEGLEKEITRLNTVAREREKNRQVLKNEYERLETIVQRATQLNELAKMCAKGKRSFLQQTGKPQAAAALGFLLDYSFFQLAEAILQEDTSREAIMWANLARICEQGKAQKLSGFDPAPFNSAPHPAHTPPVISNDRHVDRELFAYMLKMVREFGNLYLDFDFDVDATGVYRVA